MSDSLDSLQSFWVARREMTQSIKHKRWRLKFRLADVDVDASTRGISYHLPPFCLRAPLPTAVAFNTGRSKTHASKRSSRLGSSGDASPLRVVRKAVTGKAARARGGAWGGEIAWLQEASLSIIFVFISSWFIFRANGREEPSLVRMQVVKGKFQAI